jgi:hypothetical protein
MTAVDARYERWVGQLERIVQEVYRINHYRFLYRGLAEITQVANLPPSAIFDALGIWYATTQSASVRRQLDRRRGVVSLYRLLSEIANHPEVMTRDRHLALWKDEADSREAQSNFDRFAGSRERDQVDVRQVREDMARLRAIGRTVEHYVDEAVAHNADETTDEAPTYADLNAAIDAIGEIVKKYASLLKAEILWVLEPVIQGDWKAPFRKPWIPPG